MKESAALSIDAVALATGIHKDILRKWETRYGFPCPKRNSTGFRIYTEVDAQKLLLIKELMGYGYRPGKIIDKTIFELVFLLKLKKQIAIKDKSYPSDFLLLDVLISYCRRGEVFLVKHRLLEEFHALGAERFLFTIMEPLCEALGNAWASGDIAVHEEHFITEAAISVISLAYTKLECNSYPRVLLATLSGEMHTVGLLMAQLAFCLAGAHCIYLGSEVSTADIAIAAHEFDVDILALSVSSAYKRRNLKPKIISLQSNLPSHTKIWIGGKNPMIPKLPPPHLKLTNLESIFSAMEKLQPKRSV